MLDIKLIREKPDFVRARLATRHAGDEQKLDRLLAIDQEWRRALAELESAQAQRKKLTKEIGELLTKEQGSAAEQLKEQTKALKTKIDELETKVRALEVERKSLLLQIPNLPHESVPIGRDASENLVVREFGTKPKFNFQPKTHVELCEKLGLVDFERATKISGSGFILFTGLGAKLERALIQFMLDLHTSKHGYKEISPPYLVGPHCMEGVGQFPKFVDQYYAVREGVDDSTLGKLYLIPTAETPLANIHREEILSESQLPIRYCAYTPCFRCEAGAAGVSTRGLIRVHQFDKVELVKIVPPETGYQELESMVNDAEKVLQLLGLHYRVVLLCTGDMGFASAKTYDIEVWAPGQAAYLEVSSVSNCEDYQARRMNLRYKTASGRNVFPHILNGSGTALPRLYVALLETHQQEDGRVMIPAVLRPYMGCEYLCP